MKKLALILVAILSFQLSSAQIHEFGIFLGGSNFIGDVGATDFVNPNRFAWGGIYKWNRSPRHAYRLSVKTSKLKGDDSKSDDPRRIQRDYFFENRVIELSAGMEFTFLDFDLHMGEKLITPYLYTGIIASHHDNYYFQNGLQTEEGTASWAYGIPMVIGVKSNVFEHFILGFEIGARYTFSDEIDGSVPDFAKDTGDTSSSFGNLNNDDWYVFSGITLTYTFGRNPCFCPNN